MKKTEGVATGGHPAVLRDLSLCAILTSESDQ